MSEVSLDLGDCVSIYAPKEPCPRDLGFWFCPRCVAKHRLDVSESDDWWPLAGCECAYGNRVCGKTHLGWEWCEECEAAGRAEPNTHSNEFVVVGEVCT